MDTLFDTIQDPWRDLVRCIELLRSEDRDDEEVFTVPVHPRIIHLLHILRNLSFVEGPVRSLFYGHSFTRSIVVSCLKLPDLSHFVELRGYALDIVENVANFITVQSKDDKTLRALYKMLLENDKYIICGALRTLQKMCTIEQNEHVLMDPPREVTQRIIELLLVPDEEILNNALDYLYELTRSQDLANRFITELPRGVNPVKFLMKYLVWNESKDKQLVWRSRWERGPSAPYLGRQFKPAPAATATPAPIPIPVATISKTGSAGMMAPVPVPVQDKSKKMALKPEYFRALQWYVLVKTYHFCLNSLLFQSMQPFHS